MTEATQLAGEVQFYTIPEEDNEPNPSKRLAIRLARFVINGKLAPTTISEYEGIAETEGYLGMTRKLAGVARTFVNREYKVRAEMMGDEEEKEKGPTIAEVMVDMVRDKDRHILLFTNDNTESYVQIPRGGHVETYEIRSRVFKEYLTYEYQEMTGRVPNSNSLRDTINSLSALAANEGPTYKLHNRVAWHDNAIWYDLTNKNWEVVRIDENGWTILPRTPRPMFRRFDHQKPQVLPIRKERRIRTRLWPLIKFHNHSNVKNRILDLVSLVFNLVPNVPHPASIVYGPAGSGKTLGFHRPIKLLVDPSSVDQGLSLPRKKGDFPIQLDRHYYIIYSNLTKLEWWQSDVFCRAIDGAADETRKLYTDAEIKAFQYLRCIGLNGIPIVATQSDLLDRAILFPLESLAREDRMDEEELFDTFEQVRPLIFGAMLDALSAAMKIRPTVQLDYIERLGSFTKWGYAIAQALDYDPEKFLSHYAANRQKGNDEVVNSNILSRVVMEFMEKRGKLESAPKVLFTDLTEFEFGNKTPTKDWPKDATQMSKELDLLAQNLDRSGLKVQRWAEHKGRRVSFVWHEGYGPETVQELLDPNKKSGDVKDSVTRNARDASMYGTPKEAQENQNSEGGRHRGRNNALHASRVTEPKTEPKEEPKPKPKKKPLPRKKQRFKEWLSPLPNEGVRGWTVEDGVRIYGKKFYNRFYQYVEKKWLVQRGDSEFWWVPDDIKAALAGDTAKKQKRKKKKPKEAEDTKYSAGLKNHERSLEYDSKLNVKEAKERREIVRAALEYVQTLDAIVIIGEHDARLKTKWYREEITLLDSIIKKKLEQTFVQAKKQQDKKIPQKSGTEIAGGVTA